MDPALLWLQHYALSGSPWIAVPWKSSVHFLNREEKKQKCGGAFSRSRWVRQFSVFSVCLLAYLVLVRLLASADTMSFFKKLWSISGSFSCS